MNGDLTKVRWVEGLSPAAQSLLEHIEHASRNFPGSQEVRRLIRFDAQALRILYGVPIIVTCPPKSQFVNDSLRLYASTRYCFKKVIASNTFERITFMTFLT